VFYLNYSDLFIFAVIDDSDWLGLGSSTPTKDDEAEDWIKAAKLKRQQSADNSLLDPGASRASGTFRFTI